MNWVVLEICCAIASAGVPFLVALGFLGLLCLLDDGVEGMGTAAMIEVTASAGVFLLCMYLMLILTDYIVDSLADVPVNQDHKRIGRRKEEEREKKGTRPVRLVSLCELHESRDWVRIWGLCHLPGGFHGR